MARARITHRWPEGTETCCEIVVDPTFADHVDEARVQVLKLWRATCCDDAEAEAETEDDPR